VFDSDRIRNQFIATLWMHNLISAEESVWLTQFAGGRVSDAQARALVVARRTGYVTNAILRDVSGLDTLAASVQLRQLRDQGLLELRGKGSATHYVLVPRARQDATGAGFTAAGAAPSGDVQTGEFGGQTGELPAQTGELSEENRGARDELAARAALLQNLPMGLVAAVDTVGGKPSPAELRKVLVELCEVRWWTPRELAVVLKRKNAAFLSEKHLSPLVKEGKLERRYPDTHPNQAYRARQSSLIKTGEEPRGDE
jgi:ATP-dependent DNA helicase RecG